MSFYDFLFRRFGVNVENRHGNRHRIPQIALGGLFDKELGNAGGQSNARATSVGPAGRGPTRLGQGGVLRGPRDLISDHSHLM